MSLVVQIDTPYLTVDEFARRTGLSKGAVQQRARRGEYPLKPRKSNNDALFINLALLTKEALEQSR